MRQKKQNPRDTKAMRKILKNRYHGINRNGINMTPAVKALERAMAIYIASVSNHIRKIHSPDFKESAIAKRAEKLARRSANWTGLR